MNAGVLAGLTTGESSFSISRPSITTNIQSLSYTAPGDPYFNHVTLLLSENNITSKEIHFVPWNAAVGQKILPNGALTTYSLAYTTASAYGGGVLATNGEIHFVPRQAAVGQKISTDGVASTYSLIYTTTGAYTGGVLAPNGDIHFVPFGAPVGQKVSSTGTVSTYHLVYAQPTGGLAGYALGTVDRNGEIHFAPFNAPVGQKISVNGIVSTYSLVYTATNAYAGAVVAPNGDIHFIARQANRGQRVSPDGTVSTYSLVYTTSADYGFGGVLAPNGDIYFTPWSMPVGQKFGSDGIVSTYSLVYTTTVAYVEGVVDQNGDLHFIPLSAAVGQKISSSGTVSTYSLAYTLAVAYAGGVLSDNIVQNNTFLDNRLPGVAITRTGNVTQGSFSPYGDNWSNFFDGTGDYLSGIGTTSSFNFMHNSTALFTFECWVYTTSTSLQHLLDNCGTTTANFGVNLYFDSTGINLLISRGVAGIGNAVIFATSTSAVPTNQWVHIAVTYDQSQASSNAKFYINGVASGTGNKTANAPSGSNATNAMTVAGATGGGSPIVGYLSNLRITNSIVYTSAFTPPTAPLTAITNTSLLTCQSNRFRDVSTNAFAITKNGDVSVQRFSPFTTTTEYSVRTFGGSAYFDGTGDYLNTPSSADFNFGTGDYCIEAWVYLTTITSSYTLLFSSSGVNNYWGIRDVGGVGWLTSYNGSSVFEQSSTNYFQLRAWQHIAYVKNNNTYSMYLNGVSVYSISDTSSWGATAAFNIGGSPTYYPSNYQATGYVSDVRVVKGSPVYTANFTPPTAPLTAITNNSLLLNFTNQAIIDSSMNNVIETVGNARLSNVQKKWTNRSIFFDETGDYLTVPASTNMSLGTGDFTIECWVRFAVSTVGNGQGVYQLSNGYLNSAVRGPALGVENSVGDWTIYHGTNFTQSGTVPTAGVWYHTALVRSSGTTKLYVNGTSIISVADTTNYTDQYFTIGGWYSTGFLLNGYIDDLRITRGIARYTDTFTPPTGPHPRYITDYSNLLMIEYLVVAGGGNGSVFSGGGAGGMRSGILYISSGTAHQVTVGAGGGNNSIFSNIISTGGGFGGGFGAGANGGNGGSGGGAGYVGPGSTNIGTGIYGEGNNGGDQASGYGGGGGGGRAAVGGNATGSSPNITAGAGGAGAASAITGTNFTYAGGGGGGAYSPGVIAAGAGGVGGGGAGGLNATGSAGIANTGGGGGGSGNYGGGGSGGSGIVIIAYPSSRPVLSNIDVGLTHTVSTSTRAGYRVYRFTGGTGTITF